MSDGTGRIYQRGNVWWLDYGFRGERLRESTGSTKRSDAVKLLRQRMAEMGRGKLIGPDAEAVTFQALAEIITTDYRVNGRSLPRLKGSLQHLKGFFGMARALDITTDRVKAYIECRQAEGAANATIQKELAALKRAFNLAVQAGRLQGRPHIPMVRVDNARTGFFERADLDAMLKELPAHLRPLTRFAALTGWRKGECINLKWSQVDFSAGEVRLEPGTTKNKEGRTFPFRALPPLAALLREQRERTRALERERGRIIAHVFHRRGEPIRDFYSAWRAARTRAGVPDAIFHDLRRTAVRNLERAGVPRSVAMKLTGHKTESVYRRYAIADAASLAEGVEKLARLHAGAEGRESRQVVPMNEKREAK